MNFPTWSRVVNNVRRESIINQIYVGDPTAITSISTVISIFGDHILITIEYGKSKKVTKIPKEETGNTMKF